MVRMRYDSDGRVIDEASPWPWAFPVAVIILASLLACAPLPKLRVIRYCDLPRSECGALAELQPEIQAQLVEQSWCCEDAEPCYPVNALTDCSVMYVAIYCEYGRSTPASTELGTSGFECFG